MPIFKLNLDHKAPVNGVYAFYLNAFLRSLTFALISIFIPIFIYQLAGGRAKQGIILVLGFYFLVRLTVLLLALPVSRIIEKIGFRWSIGLSNLLLIAYFIFLALAPDRVYFLILAALVLGISIPFYWISRYSAITEDMADKKLGRQTGSISSLEKLAGILGPVSGAFIIKAWGYDFLYAAAIAVLAVSFAPLMFMPHHLRRNGVSLRHFFAWLKSKAFRHQAAAFAGRAVDDYSWGIFWPLAVFLLGIHLKALGLVFSFIALLTVVTRFLSGVLFDRLRRAKNHQDAPVFTFLAAANSLIWLGRILVKTIWGVVAVDSFSAVLATPYRNISDFYIYLGGRRMSEIAYYTYYELVYSIAVVVYLFLLAGAVWLGLPWERTAFVLTAIFVLVSVVQRRESRMER